MKKSKSKNSQQKKMKQQKPKIWEKKTGINAKSPFPFQYNTTFNLHQFVNIYGTGLQTYAFKLNSLWRFNETAGGGQPYYFDQLAAIYAKYRVYNVEATFHISTSNTTYSQMVIVTPKDSATGFSSMQQALEFPASKAVMIPPVGSGNILKVMKAKYDIAKILGYSVNVDDDLAAAVTASPTKNAYLLITVDTTISGNITGVQGWLQFRIRAKMYEPILVSVSLTQPEEYLYDDSENSCVITTKSQQKQEVKALKDSVQKQKLK